MDNSFLAEADLTISRTPKELLVWTEEKIEKIARTSEGTKALRFRLGLCKVLIEEVYALAIFGLHLFGNDTKIQLKPVLGNQNYDALLIDNKTNPVTVSKLEITQAHEGENTHLRMVMLEKNGYTWGSGNIEKSGTKNTGINVSVGRALTTAKAQKERVLQLIKEGIQRKVVKQYDSDTSLLLMFEDSIIVRKTNIFEEINKLLDGFVTPGSLPFSSIYVAGWFKKVLVKRGNSFIPKEEKIKHL